MADYVVKNNIGFTIKNISEMGDKMRKISDQDKTIMQNNVEKLSIHLRSGDMFRTVFKNIMNTL